MKAREVLKYWLQTFFHKADFILFRPIANITLLLRTSRKVLPVWGYIRHASRKRAAMLRNLFPWHTWKNIFELGPEKQNSAIFFADHVIRSTIITVLAALHTSFLNNCLHFMSNLSTQPPKPPAVVVNYGYKNPSCHVHVPVFPTF